MRHRGEEIGSGPVERLEVPDEAVFRLVQPGVIETTANVSSDRLERVDLGRSPWVPRAQAVGRDQPAELLASTERRGDMRHDAYAEQALANRARYQPAFLAANILEHQAAAVTKQPLEVLEHAAQPKVVQAGKDVVGKRPVLFVANRGANLPVFDKMHVSDVAVEALLDGSDSLADDLLGAQRRADTVSGLPGDSTEPGVLLRLTLLLTVRVGERVEQAGRLLDFGGARHRRAGGAVARGELPQGGDQRGQRIVRCVPCHMSYSMYPINRLAFRPPVKFTVDEPVAPLGVFQGRCSTRILMFLWVTERTDLFRADARAAPGRPSPASAAAPGAAGRRRPGRAGPGRSPRPTAARSGCPAGPKLRWMG